MIISYATEFQQNPTAAMHLALAHCLVKSHLFFLTPEALLIPKPLIYHHLARMCSEILASRLDFNRLFLQALDDLAASRSFFSSEHSIPEHFQYASYHFGAVLRVSLFTRNG